ncbi:MAG TPA: hypothetical protein ACQGQW_07780, partial [Xylella fastidiosa subsp. pauca]
AVVSKSHQEAFVHMESFHSPKTGADMVSTRWTIQYGNDSADQNRFHRHRYIIYSSLVSLVSGRKSTTYTGTAYAMYEDGTANAVM